LTPKKPANLSKKQISESMQDKRKDSSFKEKENGQKSDRRRA
jgi:hypothetical protein